MPITAHFRRHLLFSLLFQSLTLIPLQTSILSLNLKPPSCFNLSSITLFDKHLRLYLPSLCSTTFNNTLHPLVLVTLHAVSQNKTTRFVIQIVAKPISFFNSNKKMPLYIRHSRCVKIPQFQANSTPSIHLRHHYSTHITITQNLSIPYFISLLTVPIKLFQLFIPVTPLSRILLHKKGHTSQCDHLLFPIFFYLKKKGNEYFFKKHCQMTCNIFRTELKHTQRLEGL